MLLAARRVLAFTQGLDAEGFHADEVMQSAVMHQLQVIGEVARRVSAPYAEQHAEIP
jgi:uncharacterized protein with HEPN domain